MGARSVHTLDTGMDDNRLMREHQQGAWLPDQVVDFMLDAIVGRRFYILCPDDEVTPEEGRRRVLWRRETLPTTGRHYRAGTRNSVTHSKHSRCRAMSKQLTVLLAGRMSELRAEWLGEQLTTDWRIEVWSEDEPFERFAKLIVQADAMVAGWIKGDWPATPNLKLYQVPFTGYEFLEKPEDLPQAGCTPAIPMAAKWRSPSSSWRVCWSARSASRNMIVSSAKWDGRAPGTRHRAEPWRAVG